MNKLITLTTIIGVSLSLASTASAAPEDFRYVTGWHTNVDGMERVHGVNGEAFRALLQADGYSRSDINAIYRDDNGIYFVKLDPGASPRGNDA